MPYQEPMLAWPNLSPYGANVTLKQTGLRLYIYDAGPQDAPAVLLVHGLGDESDTWRYILPPLAVHQRVIALDLPGFGRSDPLPQYRIPKILDVLLDLLATLDIPDATFVGSSLGGVLSHAIAVQHPERVRELVLLDGHLATKKQNFNLDTLLFLLPGIGEWRYSAYRKNPQAAYESLRPFYADPDMLPEKDREFLFKRVNVRVWSQKQRRAYLSTLRNTFFWMAKQQRILVGRLKNLNVPTVVIYGEEDHMMPPANAQHLRELQTGVDIVILPGVGHLPHQEAPDQVLAVVKQATGLKVPEG